MEIFIVGLTDIDLAVAKPTYSVERCGFGLLPKVCKLEQ